MTDIEVYIILTVIRNRIFIGRSLEIYVQISRPFDSVR